MKILVIGSNGQVGWELCRALAPLGELVTAGRAGRAEKVIDFEDSATISAVSNAVRPDVIVNAAAYTNVDAAEQDVDRANLVNTVAPGVLADWALRHDALLVHYSTDYVFAGSGDEPWRETDVKSPLNVYGKSKLAGDEAIAASGCRHLVFRTSWIYSARGKNFFRTMLRLAGERDILRVVNDQVGSPTNAELIADVTAQAIASVGAGRARTGTFHLAADGYASWCDFAQHIFDCLAKRTGEPAEGRVVVEPVSSDEYPTKASRPMNSRLSTDTLREAFGLRFPHWTVGVERAVAEYCERNNIE